MLVVIEISIILSYNYTLSSSLLQYKWKAYKATDISSDDKITFYLTVQNLFYCWFSWCASLQLEQSHLD